MSEILSSWKEVARFFGKGVRTVQRWERTAGLPVHRPKPFAVLAYPAELESWLRKNDREPSSEPRPGEAANNDRYPPVSLP